MPACTHRATGSERAVKIIPRSSKEEENIAVRNEFNVVKMPLLVEEVRGKERLEK